MSQQFQPPGECPEDPIDLGMLPPAHQARARAILREVAAGAPLARFKGKRLKNDRALISVPLGGNWRLLFEEVDGKPVPRGCMSHSDYNGRKPGLRRTGKKQKKRRRDRRAAI